MPQLLLIVLAGAGVWAGYRWYRKEQDRVKATLREAENELGRRYKKEAPTLKRDPETGVYSPPDDR